MKKDRIFIIVFGVLFITYVIIDFMTPKPINWMVTYRTDDKNPFGGFILNERSSDLFEGGFELSTQTIAELANEEENLLILAEYADISDADQSKLFEILDRGGQVFIGATSFNYQLLDTLAFDVHFEYQLLDQRIFEVPQSTLKLKPSQYEYLYPSSLLLNYFDLESTHDWEVIATVDDRPVVMSKTIGEGRITIASIPLIFTNFGMLYDQNYRAVEELLRLLPSQNVHYTMFYKSGRREATTPFRYFLREDALRWSLYLGLFLVTLFLIISSRRKQRPIPVIKPPENTTVQYVKTLGSLFYRERNHKKAAMKLIGHFLNEIKERYFLQVVYEEKFYHLLASKSGKELTKVIRTFELIQQVKASNQIEEKKLIDLSKKIESFNQ